MFGAFKPSQPLFGGLLWKIPWRMSSNQKLRQRRRLRRVDNIVTILDNALKRQTASSALPKSSNMKSSQPPPHPDGSSSSSSSTPSEIQGVSAGDLSQTVEGRSLLQSAANQDLESRRHGKGPKQGDMLPEHTAHGVEVPSSQVTLSAEAARAGTIRVIERWKAEMPKESEMLPRDKYSMFDRKAKKYRKGIHKLPKWTRVSQRVNPPGF